MPEVTRSCRNVYGDEIREKPAIDGTPSKRGLDMSFGAFLLHKN
jgi:hypothetical protein